MFIIVTKGKTSKSLIKQESLISLYFGIYIFEMWKINSLILQPNLLKPYQEFLPIYCFIFSVTIENIR